MLLRIHMPMKECWCLCAGRIGGLKGHRWLLMAIDAKVTLRVPFPLLLRPHLVSASVPPSFAKQRTQQADAYQGKASLRTKRRR